ncbi:MAG: hypothetical protein ACXWK3_01470 [Reyranella sp.]
MMLVDDVWATIGSCNLHAYSLSGNSEMNASIWDAGVVRALRCTLLAQHLDRETGDLDDRAALRLFREIADANRLKMDRLKMDRMELDWQGLAFALRPDAYAINDAKPPAEDQAGNSVIPT